MSQNELPLEPKETKALEPPKPKLTAKQAAVIGLSLKPFKQQMSRTMRKRIESVSPVSLEAAQLVIAEATDEILLELYTWVTRGTNTQIVYNYVKYPATWLQHAKMAFYDLLPAPLASWLHEKWPIAMHNEEVPFEQHIHVCPHSNFPSGSAKHIEFLVEKCEGTNQLLQMIEGLDKALREPCPNCGRGNRTATGAELLLQTKRAARGEK